MAFGFYTPLTITSNSSLLPATQTNFPLLLSFTDNRFKTVGNGGHVQNSSGFDIRPYSNSSLTTALSYERVSYSASAGTFQIWVLIPSLSQGLVIYLAYGDAALSSDGTSLSAVSTGSPHPSPRSGPTAHSRGKAGTSSRPRLKAACCYPKMTR